MVEVTDIDGLAFFADLVESTKYTDPKTGEEKDLFKLSASEEQERADPENVQFEILKNLSRMVAYRLYQENRILELQGIIEGDPVAAPPVAEWVAALNSDPNDEDTKAKLYEIWHPNLPLGGRIIDDRLQKYVIEKCEWIPPGMFKIQGRRIMDETGRLSTQLSKIEYARLIEG